MRIKKLEFQLSSIDRRGDARQLVLIAFLGAFGCGDGFTSGRLFSWPTDATIPRADADIPDSGTTTTDPKEASDSTRVSNPRDAGAEATSIVDAETTPLPTTSSPPPPPPPPPKDSGSPPADAHTAPPPPPPPPTCVKYVGAVFVCSGATPVTYYPCPVRPPGCVQAGNTAVVCCPN